MSGHDVDLNYEHLLELATGLEVILAEFQDASSAAEASSPTSGAPTTAATSGTRRGLRGELERQPRRRSPRSLQAVLDHLKNVIDGFSETDAALAAPAGAPPAS